MAVVNRRVHHRKIVSFRMLAATTAAASGLKIKTVSKLL
jgi:hypothetical protein